MRSIPVLIEFSWLTQGFPDIAQPLTLLVPTPFKTWRVYPLYSFDATAPPLYSVDTAKYFSYPCFSHTPINMTVCFLSCFDYAFDCSLSNLNPFLLWHRQRQHQSAWFAVLVDYPIIVPKHFKPSLRRDAGMMWSALARYKTNPTS